MLIPAVLVFATSGAQAQSRPPVSQCQAIAERLPDVKFASLAPVAYEAPEVAITFVGHSTFLIETPGGLRIATDYSGFSLPGGAADVATMNKAHESHFTLMPDPEIEIVLHGWGDTPGQPADHDLVVEDTYIRNVTTDIRSWASDDGFEHDGNSIFIFEVADLCIGHLGHLHHELTDKHIAEIGRLDIVMVPVDGGLTLGAESMRNVIERLHSSLVLPMHRTGPRVRDFAAMFADQYEIVYSEDRTVRVSLSSLPRPPRILLLQGVW
ncbi:Zn-dependent hydrolase [Martelella endophytica]|uniref:Zn-dependent hydrolase n=2 Tax=Martelella endophytica TaxID=1486262 RepID=A0A0D5LV80_MAREN|nr:Zn-dependent hydrolase [Martelella endophytica]